MIDNDSLVNFHKLAKKLNYVRYNFQYKVIVFIKKQSLQNNDYYVT